VAAAGEVPGDGDSSLRLWLRFDVAGVAVAVAAGASVAVVAGASVALVAGASVAVVTGASVAAVTGASVAVVTGASVAVVSGARVAVVAGALVAVPAAAPGVPACWESRPPSTTACDSHSYLPALVVPKYRSPLRWNTLESVFNHTTGSFTGHAGRVAVPAGVCAKAGRLEAANAAANAKERKVRMGLPL
jgi:hypothetical protein